MQIGSIQWVDLNRGQLTNYEQRPAVDFPAVLLAISYPRSVQVSRNVQQCEVTIEVTIVFDSFGDTSSITPDQILQESLHVLDTLEEVHRSLQGLMDIDVVRTPLDRMSMKDPLRNDGLKTYVMTYSTRILE